MTSHFISHITSQHTIHHITYHFTHHHIDLDHTCCTSTTPQCNLPPGQGSHFFNTLRHYHSSLFSTSASPYCTVSHCRGLHFYVYIIILHSTSLLWVTLLRQVHHATALRQTHFYKYITTLHFTSLPRVTLLLEHHHTALYVTALGHSTFTNRSPY